MNEPFTIPAEFVDQVRAVAPDAEQLLTLLAAENPDGHEVDQLLFDTLEPIWRKGRHNLEELYMELKIRRILVKWYELTDGKYA